MIDVTGAGVGIERELVIHLLEKGASVTAVLLEKSRNNEFRVLAGTNPKKAAELIVEKIKIK